MQQHRIIESSLALTILRWIPDQALGKPRWSGMTGLGF
jgi:hypothetical protein